MPILSSAGRKICLALFCIVLAGGLGFANNAHAFSNSSEIEAQKAPGKCSIADGETLKIASWNIGNRDYQTRMRADAFDDFVRMAQKIDADVIAFQEVTSKADEVIELAAALHSETRCYGSIVSARRYCD